MLGGLSRCELVVAMDLATRCLAVRTFSELEDVVTGLRNALPFERAVLCAITPDESGPSLHHVVNHSFGDEWASVYTRRGFHRVDPVLCHGSASNGAFAWSDAFRSGANRAGAAFLEAARDFGLVDGVTYSCASQPASSIRTLVSMSGMDTAISERAIRVLTGIGPHVHEAYRRLLAGPADRALAAKLSPREKEVLNWAKEGKTYWEIGCILGISQRTVKYHFASIKSKLDVMSRCHAIAKAMRLGVIA